MSIVGYTGLVLFLFATGYLVALEVHRRGGR